MAQREEAYMIFARPLEEVNSDGYCDRNTTRVVVSAGDDYKLILVTLESETTKVCDTLTNLLMVSKFFPSKVTVTPLKRTVETVVEWRPIVEKKE
jgi:hypothetical protein